MTPTQQKAISEFFKAILGLRQTGIIRSQRYLADLGEFLCADTFGIDLARSLREVGHDGLRGAVRVQVKYHGGKSTTANLGNPDQYDEVYLVLGPDSVLRPKGLAEDFLIYQFAATAVKKFESSKSVGNHYCTKARIPTNPVRKISLSVSEVKA